MLNEFLLKMDNQFEHELGTLISALGLNELGHAIGVGV